MKMARYAVAIVLYFVSIHVYASDAFVFAEDEFGQGFFRERGHECFFITAGHVVENSVDIELVTSSYSRYKAMLVTSFPDDVAILSVDLPDNEKCPKSSWDSGSTLRTLLKVEQEGVVKTRLDDGSVMQTPVNIKTYDSYRFIQVTPKNINDNFTKGFSGSPFFIAGKLAGMLQSVNSGVGNVFRQDALNNTVALFFRDEKKNENKGDSVEVVTAVNKPPSVIDEKFINNKPNTLDSYSGNLADGQSIEYKFEGQKNTPLLIKALDGKDLRFHIRIYEGDTKLYEASQSQSKEIRHVFTPQRDGVYTIQLAGYRGYGEYKVSMETIATATALTGKANVISPGATVTGNMANGAVAEYRFEGQKNTPLLIKALDGKDLRFHIRIYEGDKKLYEASQSQDKEVRHAFTPQRDGVYTIQLLGYRGYGEYKISMETIATATALMGKANVMSPGDTVTGDMANGAIAEYRFEGQKNTPLLIKALDGKGLRFHIRIYEGDKKLYEASQSQSKEIRHVFTPQRDGVYSIRLTGYRGYGEYKVSMD